MTWILLKTLSGAMAPTGCPAPLADRQGLPPWPWIRCGRKVPDSASDESRGKGCGDKSAAGGGQGPGRRGAKYGARGAAWPQGPGRSVAATRTAPPRKGGPAGRKTKRGRKVMARSGARQREGRRGGKGEGGGAGTRPQHAGGGSPSRGQRTTPLAVRNRRAPAPRLTSLGGPARPSQRPDADRVQPLSKDPPQRIFAAGSREAGTGLAQALGDPARPAATL